MPRGRASNGSGTQPRQRADGRWEVKYCVGIDPGTGKTIRKSLYGKTADEVARKLREITASLDAGTHIEPQKMPLSQWLDTWLQEYCKAIKPSTMTVYRGYIENHIKPGLGAVHLCDLQPHQVQKFVNRLDRQGNGTKALSYKTRRNIHGCLSAALETAKEIRYIRDNPASGCRIPRNADEAPEQICPLEGDELPHFIQAIKGNPHEHIFLLALFTGMRLSEILGLRWQCVDFNTHQITVNRQLTLARKDLPRTLSSTKNRKARAFIAAPDAIEVLRDAQRQQRVMKLQAGNAWSNPDGLVFTDALGNGVSHRSVDVQFKKIVKGMGIPERRFHDLRHTYATVGLLSGVNVETISKNLGHFSVGFTLDQYGHVTDQMCQDAANRMQGMIEQWKKAAL